MLRLCVCLLSGRLVTRPHVCVCAYFAVYAVEACPLLARETLSFEFTLTRIFTKRGACCIACSAVKKLIGNLLVVNRHRRFTAVDVLADPFVLTVGGSVAIDDRRLDEPRRLTAG